MNQINFFSLLGDKIFYCFVGGDSFIFIEKSSLLRRVFGIIFFKDDFFDLLNRLRFLKTDGFSFTFYQFDFDVDFSVQFENDD